MRTYQKFIKPFRYIENHTLTGGSTKIICTVRLQHKNEVANLNVYIKFKNKSFILISS